MVLKTYTGLFLEALFIMAWPENNLMDIDSRMDKLWHNHTTEYLVKMIMSSQPGWISQIQYWLKEARH